MITHTSLMKSYFPFNPTQGVNLCPQCVRFSLVKNEHGKWVCSSCETFKSGNKHVTCEAKR